MNISQVAGRAGVPPKTIRYYEDIALIPKAARTPSGYRRYEEADVHRLRFLQRARSLGFPVEECRRLLALWQDPGRASSDVKRLAEQRIAEIDRKIEALRSIRQSLAHLAEHCRGDARPECPIIDDLARRA